MSGKRSIPSLLLAAVLAFSGAAFANTGGAYDPQIQTAVSKQLQQSEFRNVRATVAQGVVTLQGTVPTYQRKLDAAKKARKTGHVTGVKDLIQVAGITVPDTALRDRLAKALLYDRSGYGHVFDVLNVGVKNGIVTLSGEVHTPVDRESALGIVATTPGVKGMVDQLKVAPTSIFDDALRLRTARAIYGDSTLSRYALDPAAPIRIQVDRGHVSLYGTVADKMDSQLAYMRASQVFGAFSVENHLTIGDGRAR